MNTPYIACVCFFRKRVPMANCSTTLEVEFEVQTQSVSIFMISWYYLLLAKVCLPATGCTLVSLVSGVAVAQGTKTDGIKHTLTWFFFFS